MYRTSKHLDKLLNTSRKRISKRMKLQVMKGSAMRVLTRAAQRISVDSYLAVLMISQRLKLKTMLGLQI